MQDGASWSGNERNCAYLNVGGSFANVSGVTGADFLDDARAVATVDWDDDGKLDLILKNRTAPRLRFLRNQDSGNGNFISLSLRATTSHPDAIGAKVLATAGGKTFRRTLYAGDGYLSQSSKKIHFGLGAAEKVARLEVIWPDGANDVWTDLKVNQRYNLTQGKVQAERRRPRSHPRFASLATRPAKVEAGSDRRIVLADKLPLANLPLPSWTHPQRKVGDLAGGPVLVVLWATWCANCHAEFGHWQSMVDTFGRMGLKVVPMSTDEPSKFTLAQEQLTAYGLSAWAGPASASFADAFGAVFEEILGAGAQQALPTSFLLDGAGQLVTIYEGAVDPRRLLRDVAALKKMSPQNRQNPGLIGGEWTIQRSRNFGRLANQFREMGMPNAAADFSKRTQKNR